MLGIHIKVAVAWQHASSGDWMTYAADLGRRDSATHTAKSNGPVLPQHQHCNHEQPRSRQPIQPAAAGIAETADYKNAETTNLIVIGMIPIFAAIMLVNTLVAATTHRRREFGQYRLVGATPRQVLHLVVAEGTALTGMGVLLGTVASLLTVVPFSIARSGSPLPDGGITPYLGVVATAAAMTLLTSIAATRLATRTPAVEAVAG
jgi:hypothetical protein